MKVVAIIQARLGSTRLPGKVLQDIGGATMLARVVRRTQRAQRVDQVVVATTTNPLDDAVVAECERLRIAAFRGSEEDVLDRYYRAARACVAEVVVRITSDCPLIDPGLIDDVVLAFQQNECDYAANILDRTYPRGLDVEAVGAPRLNWLWRTTTERHHRAHVLVYLYEHRTELRTCSVKGATDYSHWRWTVDTADDLELVRAIYSRFGNDDWFDWRAALDVIEREPVLAMLNSHVQQKPPRKG